MDPHRYPSELNLHFLQGLRLFDEQQYFEAHDEIEEIWFDEVGQAKLAAQALIQLTVGLYHRERDNLRGARKLFNRASEILEPLDDHVLNLDIRDLQSRSKLLAEEVQGQIQANEPTFDPALVPSFSALRKSLEERRQQLGLEQ